MNVVICTIAKYENNYIKEWVDYHINLGFSHIYIYDNNDVHGESIQETFLSEGYSNKLTIINVKGKRYIQKEVYNDCYYHFEFDWCAFIDVDEFITFNKNSRYTNIIDFIKDRNDFEAIHINWICHGDNGKFLEEQGNVIDRFPKPVKPLNFKCAYDFPENNHIKSILKKGLNINWDSNPHTPSGTFNICDENGKKIMTNLPYRDFSFETIYIRHFYTKSVEEYALKIRRQCADIDSSPYDFSRFYRINSFTYKKIKVQKKLINKYSLHSYRNSVLSCFKEFIKYHYLSRYKILSVFYRKFPSVKKVTGF